LSATSCCSNSTILPALAAPYGTYNSSSSRTRRATTCRLLSSSRDDDDCAAAKQHRLFQQQLAELNEERQFLFGTSEDNDAIDSSPNNQDDDFKVTAEQIIAREVTMTTVSLDDESDQQQQQRMEELKEERQQLYGFSVEEEQAWGRAGGAAHQHHASFMQQIDDARREQEEQQQQSQQIKKDGNLPSSSARIPPPPPPPPPSNNNDPTNTTDTLTHVSSDGRTVHMVDVGHKVATRRTATAETVVVFPDEVLTAFSKQESNDELVGPKGPIFATATLAGIMAAKQTSNLIPLCHPLPLEQVTIDITWSSRNSIVIRCHCRVTHKTGVEMEALTGATVAALTVYDMVKAVSHNVVIASTQLVQKDGGKRRVADKKTATATATARR